MVDTGTPQIFDRVLLTARRKRQIAQFSQHRFLHDWAGEQALQRFEEITRCFPVALEIGHAHEQALTQKICSAASIETLVSMDAAPELLNKGAASLIADEEFLPFKDASLDLIFSTLSLHTVNDLPGALVQMRRALKPDGLFMASLFGGETLFELREALAQAELETKGGISPRVYPFADKPQMGDLLQRSGFALPVVDSDIITVTYENFFKLAHDLRGMGQGNIIRERSRINPGKEFFSKAAAYYHDKFSEADGRIKASFEIIHVIGWVPHETQQKPLAPGSAQIKLSDALGTEEIKAGEEAKP